MDRHTLGSVDDPKSWEERDSDGGEREREEEEVADQQEGDTEKDEGLKDEVVEVAIEEKSLENGSGSVVYSAVSTREEDSVAENSGLEDKEVAVEEEDEKSVIAQFGEQKAESSVIDDKTIVDYAEEEAPVKFNKSVGAQNIDDEEEDLSKKVVQLAPKGFTSAGAESLVMLVQADELASELATNGYSSFSQTTKEKEEFPSAIETRKSEQIENPVEAVAIDDQAKSVIAVVVSDGAQIEALPIGLQAKSLVAPVVSNGAANGAAAEPLETDDLGDALAINTSRAVDNGKELEIQKNPSEEPPPIGSIPFPVRRTSWTGCCGLFEVFSGAR